MNIISNLNEILWGENSVLQQIKSWTQKCRETMISKAEYDVFSEG